MKTIWDLKNLMIRISERCYCAGWIDDLEFELWKFVCQAEQSKKYDKIEWGQDEITGEELKLLKEMSEKLQGWWIFNLEEERDENYNFIKNIGYAGLAFIPLHGWEEYYEQKKGE